MFAIAMSTNSIKLSNQVCGCIKETNSDQFLDTLFLNLWASKLTVAVSGAFGEITGFFWLSTSFVD